jgi:hypothetical protein
VGEHDRRVRERRRLAGGQALSVSFHPTGRRRGRRARALGASPRRRRGRLVALGWKVLRSVTGRGGQGDRGRALVAPA